MTDQTAIETYERAFPEIPWRRPVMVRVLDMEVWDCRFCIGALGLAAANIVDGTRGFSSFERFAEHMRTEHGVEPDWP